MKKYSPLCVANQFIKISPNGETHMKLQKLVYMAYGAWLRENNEPFITEEPQVWQYGPVFASLYHNLKIFRSTPITSSQLATLQSTEEINEAEAITTTQSVWERYKDYTAADLSDITHQSGSPWYEVAKENNFRVPQGTTIPTEIIKQHFRAYPDK